MRKIQLVLVALIVLILSAFKADHVITIYMIGDSTMSNKPLEGNNQERGWGHVLGSFFTEDVRVENHAMNGRSSKSFIDEGRWKTVVNKIRPGDYVFIQFGHNDENLSRNVIQIRELPSMRIYGNLFVKHVPKEEFLCCLILSCVGILV